MMESRTAARPYVGAAFEFAQSKSALSDWSEMLAFVAAVVSDAQFNTVMQNPGMQQGKLAELLFDICEGRINDSFKNYLNTVISAGRLALAPEISEMFDIKKAEAEAVAVVDVISAYPLDSAQQASLEQAMEKKLGRKVEISASVDESIIGGAVIRVGDSVIDASTRGRLDSLGLAFAE